MLYRYDLSLGILSSAAVAHDESRPFLRGGHFVFGGHIFFFDNLHVARKVVPVISCCWVMMRRRKGRNKKLGPSKSASVSYLYARW